MCLHAGEHRPCFRTAKPRMLSRRFPVSPGRTVRSRAAPPATLLEYNPFLRITLPDKIPSWRAVQAHRASLGRGICQHDLLPFRMRGCQHRQCKQQCANRFHIFDRTSALMIQRSCAFLLLVVAGAQPFGLTPIFTSGEPNEAGIKVARYICSPPTIIQI